MLFSSYAPPLLGAGGYKKEPKKMAKEIIVNVDHRETRIAVLVDKQLTELHVEREQRVVGNLYKAKVDNVLPGMDAAFVEIGLERNAFLYVADILPEDDEDGGPRRNRRDLHITDLVKRGDQLLVQVVKGPRSTKGSAGFVAGVPAGPLFGADARRQQPGRLAQN